MRFTESESLVIGPRHLNFRPASLVPLADTTILETFFQSYSVQFSSFQSLNCVQLFATPWTAACQASLSLAISRSLLKLMSMESVMPSNHLILCRPLLLLPSVFLSIGVFSNESALCFRWPNYWSFSFCISPSSECIGLIFGLPS